jgi:hypothetical protein
MTDGAKMTFQEAMARSNELQLAALMAIALRLPEPERKRRMRAYIDFNPYLYLDDKCPSPYAAQS